MPFRPATSATTGATNTAESAKTNRVDEHGIGRDGVAQQGVNVVLEGEALGLGHLGAKVRDVDLARPAFRRGPG